jgi:hypothetical protein
VFRHWEIQFLPPPFAILAPHSMSTVCMNFELVCVGSEVLLNITLMQLYVTVRMKKCVQLLCFGWRYFKAEKNTWPSLKKLVTFTTWVCPALPYGCLLAPKLSNSKLIKSFTQPRHKIRPSSMLHPIFTFWMLFLWENWNTETLPTKLNMVLR